MYRSDDPAAFSKDSQAFARRSNSVESEMIGLLTISISSNRPLRMVVALKPAAGVAQTFAQCTALNSAANAIAALMSTR
jgi:hypothetical protein